MMTSFDPLDHAVSACLHVARDLPIAQGRQDPRPAQSAPARGDRGVRERRYRVALARG
jgi:hypothetical protein